MNEIAHIRQTDMLDHAPGDTGLHLSGLRREIAGRVILEALDLHFESGALTVILGPSGCGKSTLLRLIAGLDSPDGGSLSAGGRDLTAVPPAARDIAMVFQNYALFPHLTVAENILFGLSLRRVAKPDQSRRLARVVEMLGLGGLERRKPAQLSGGQQQRVALARALISERPICLMDEPLSNLDAKLRAEMRAEIRALQQRLGLTMIYVTHDQVEAMTMADKIVLMNAGRIAQEGSPAAVYAAPASTFAARFIGMPPMNLLPGAALGLSGAAAAETIGLRAEDVRLDPQGLPARIMCHEFHGADLFVTVLLGESPLVLRLPARAGSPANTGLPGDGILHLGWDAAALHRFDPASGQRLP
ncbi:ABC transporter ATP-binding protein [Phaeovulum sp. W22_SRMD_FR3]|uniref:ABC transporter ATP-binding protein n=1 Tax=Phaeovulum sp. W22_SRMD_FR3 TaxID=3240274 RepID=UPI003F9D20A0